LARADPKKAAAITRALMRGTAWIRSHPSEGARLEVDMKHVSGSLADNERAMASLDFFPSVGIARRNTLDILQRFKRLGFIDSAIDEPSLLDQIFIPVTQEL
jgi:NitT/TauT family transport system substrate-binding protein